MPPTASPRTLVVLWFVGALMAVVAALLPLRRGAPVQWIFVAMAAAFAVVGSAALARTRGR